MPSPAISIRLQLAEVRLRDVTERLQQVQSGLRACLEWLRAHARETDEPDNN
jgi:hypothetical protein